MALYTTPFNAVAITAQQDLFEIAGPSDAITIIHAVKLSNLTEIGDAQEEMLSILYKRGQTTTGSGGSTVTPNSTATGSTAYGGVTKTNNTTKATVGTILTLDADGWNIRTPYLWLPTPEMRLVIGPSIRLTVELATTPADSITMSGTIYFEELGG